MTAWAEFMGAIPADQLTPEVREAMLRLADENALLRAALADMRARVGDLEQSADNDALTGLPNERDFDRQLERVVAQAERHGTPAALVSLDLKGLKAINERHGHVAGDAALIHVAGLLRGLIRTTDMAARTGGGFSLILDHLDADSAIDTGERIARFIADQPLDLGSRRVRVDATVGVAAILPGDTAEDVLGRARRNLDRVKEF